jgi:hypothetical protein
MAKKFFKTDKEQKVGKLSEGFATTKTGKQDKKNKPSKSDDLEFEDGTILMVDTAVKCRTLIGKVVMFSVKGGSLEINGKRKV